MYSFAHPQNCKDSIPYSQFLRVRRICSEDKDFNTQCNVLKQHFIRRNYPPIILDEAIELAKSKKREDLLKVKTKKDEDQNKVFLITTHHLQQNFVPNLVRKNWPILGRNNTTMFLHEKHLVCGYRRPKNLRDILMRAKVKPKTEDITVNPYYKEKIKETQIIENKNPINNPKQKLMTDFMFKTNSPTGTKLQKCSSLPDLSKKDKKTFVKKGQRGFNFCNNPKCRFCPLLNKSGKIECTYSKEIHSTMKNVSCRSSNLIYCITCTVCHKQYVGQTSNRLKDRFQGHFGDITRDDKEKTIPIHYNSQNHRGVKDMNITILEFIKKPPKSLQAIKIRLRREKHWTYLLHTLSPLGLNMENPKEFKLQKS